MLHANVVDPLTVCDVGCGAGEVLARLARFYDSDVAFSGYEISSQAFGICRQKATGNLHFYRQDVLAQRDARFDVVENYPEFLRQVRTLGTYKIFHIPLDLSVQTVIRVAPLLRYRESVGHIHYSSKRQPSPLSMTPVTSSLTGSTRQARWICRTEAGRRGPLGCPEEPCFRSTETWRSGC